MNQFNPTSLHWTKKSSLSTPCTETQHVQYWEICVGNSSWDKAARRCPEPPHLPYPRSVSTKCSQRKKKKKKTEAEPPIIHLQMHKRKAKSHRQSPLPSTMLLTRSQPFGISMPLLERHHPNCRQHQVQQCTSLWWEKSFYSLPNILLLINK